MLVLSSYSGRASAVGHWQSIYSVNEYSVSSRPALVHTILDLWHSVPHKCRCTVCRRGRCLACLSKDRAAGQQTQCLRRLLDNRPCFYFISDSGTGQRGGTYDRTLWPSIDRFCNHTLTTKYRNVRNEANLIARAHYTEQWFLLVCLGWKVQPRYRVQF